MPLEEALEANTQALKELTAALVPGGVAAPSEEAPKPKKKKTTKKKEPEPSEVEEPETDYAAVQKAIHEIVAKDGGVPDRAMALLEEFGATHGDQLKEEQYTEVVEKATALLAA